MITKKGWQQNLMFSLYKKEASYNAGVTMDATSACSMKGYEIGPAWEDEIINDKGEITGTEHGTDQEIGTQSVKLAYKESKAKPNTLAGLGALVMGAITSTQDGTATAYKHKIIPVAVGTAIPSMRAEHKKGGLQYTYDGLKGNSIRITGEAGGMASVDCELLGSGTRATSSSAFAAAITESWLKLSNCKVWMESGAEISISAALVQDAEDISSAAPDDLKARIKSFDWAFLNNLEKQIGFGGAGILQDMDYARRAVELKFTLLFADATELDLFLNQTPIAIEFDLKGALIATGGTMYYGFQLIIPRFKIKSAPLAIGGVGDILTVDIDCDVEDDGTNPVSILEVYNAKAAYLA